MQGVIQPGMDAQAGAVMPHKAAEKLWRALQPGRQPRAFRRGGSIECHVPSTPHLSRVLASVVMWPRAGSAAEQYEPRRQALLLKAAPDTAGSRCKQRQCALDR